MSITLRIILLLIAAVALAALARAASDPVILYPDVLAEKEYVVQLTMPCNWDKNLAKVKSYGFYGLSEPFNRSLITDASALRITSDLKITYDQGVVNGPMEEPLHHLQIEFGQTASKCAETFGFNSLSK